MACCPRYSYGIGKLRGSLAFPQKGRAAIRLMKSEQIPAYVDDLLDAGCDITLIDGDIQRRSCLLHFLRREAEFSKVGDEWDEAVSER